MNIRGTVKTLYQVLALLALLNAAVLIGGASWLAGTGQLSAARIDRLVAAWREPAATSTQPAQAEAAKPMTRSAASAEAIARDALESEMTRRERERIKAELEQKEQVIRAELVYVSQKRDAFEDLQKKEGERVRQLSQIQQQDGYRKQLDIVSNLTPKAAVEFLMTQQPADAARMLLDMEARQAKKIYEAAKGRQDKTRMNEILSLVREMAPGKADEMSRK
jgi:hypothetical protein